MIHLGIIEDDEGIRETLIASLQNEKEFDKIIGAPSVEDFFFILEKGPEPDIILLDINLPGMSGIEAIPKLKQRLPEVSIIMNSVMSDHNSIFYSLCAGASGYIDKETSLEKIKEAIIVMSNGGSPMTPSIARKVVEYFNPQKKFTEDLTAREREIVEAIVSGLSYKLTADKLKISLDTVRKHINRIYRKLQINNKGELIARFHRGI